MYLKIVLQRLDDARRKLWRVAVMQSGLMTLVFLILLLTGFAFAWREHMRGHFGQLKRTLQDKPAAQETGIRPGGQDVLQLKRSQLPGENGPEFLSATLLPGRGLHVLQITAYVPGKGEVSLLASPSLEEASRLMNGVGSDAAGGESLTMGGAIEAPWAGQIFGVEAAGGLSLTTMWRGHRLNLPVTGSKETSTGGLLLRRASATQSTNIMPDGEEAQVSFAAGDFDEHWISQTTLTSTIELNSRSIDMTVTARNTGSEAEPIGIGWRPRFAILGDRKQAVLHIPATDREEIANPRTGLPSGRLLPVAGTQYDFSARDGARLGSLSLNDTFVHLKSGFMDNGPIAQLIDPQSGYKLNITVMTSNIKAMRVVAPVDAGYIMIDPMFNYNDPFGREWAKEDTGMVVLQPGQSVQWKIRLEISSLTPAGDNPL